MDLAHAQLQQPAAVQTTPANPDNVECSPCCHARRACRHLKLPPFSGIHHNEAYSLSSGTGQGGLAAVQAHCQARCNIAAMVKAGGGASAAEALDALWLGSLQSFFSECIVLNLNYISIITLNRSFRGGQVRQARGP